MVMLEKGSKSPKKSLRLCVNRLNSKSSLPGVIGRQDDPVIGLDFSNF
jgi:hypothetical protein